MNWNRYQENILKKWSSMAKTYSTMHSISSEYYSKLDKRLGIPVILLGAAASSSIFTTNSQNDDKNIWTYINGGMVLIMTGISGIAKFLGTNEKQAKHTAASFKYTHISMDIDTLLSFPRSDRTEQPRQFINDIKLSILEVREHAPDLPTWLVSDYIKKLDKSLVNTQTKVNRHKQGDSVEMIVPNDWNTTTYKSSRPNTPEKKTETDTVDTVQAISPVKQEPQQISSVVSNDKRQKTSDTCFLDIGDVYSDYLSPNDKVYKKIERVSSKLESHASQSDTESEEEE